MTSPNREFTCTHDEWINTLDQYRETMGVKRNPNPAYVDPAAFIGILSGRNEG